MKAFAVIFSLLSLTLAANAQLSCLGEAQIIAKVESVKTDSLTYCRVMVKQVSFYNESIVCPLDLSEVMDQGIEIGLKNGHDCDVDSNTISGVLVKTKRGDIIIE